MFEGRPAAAQKGGTAGDRQEGSEMRVEMAEMLDGVQRSPAEHAWIKACRSREATRGHEPRPETGQLEHLIITALDHCVSWGG